ncbi:metallophosphoesterase family protein [Neptunicoccus cionae]|uniref:Serine/threonine protein phosphatase n=1 Tax=Neptunicoccus cionae TaxID=2035344 RepID=A0A916VPR6_9RHOB|nr:metallophosphoesterase [Amylibacter cionae]GGA14978.1 serine/threonine protein phosphatase [Amylibacter cionae]
MRILAFSDLHANQAVADTLVAASASADLVIAAGDFCNFHKGLEEAVAMLEPIPCPIIAVPGNHETADALCAVAPPRMTVLHGQSHAIGTLDIFGIGYGIPLSPFTDWSVDLTDAQAYEMLENCHQADIIVSHSPPINLGDRTSQGQHVGSAALREAIERLKPKFFFCGHIHESWGTAGKIGETEVYNLGPSINWFDI